MDWLLPVLILSILLFAFLWWYEFPGVGGREVGGCLVFGDFVRCSYPSSMLPNHVRDRLSWCDEDDPSDNKSSND
jgi:hypothetical protein